MADIPGIPSPERKPRKKKRRVTTTKHWIEKGYLTPWMHHYAQWLASQPTAVLSLKGAPVGYRRAPPTVAQRTAKASWFAKQKIGQEIIRALEQRPDFIKYFEKLRSDIQFQAKEMMQQDIIEGIEARREGLRMARGWVKAEVEHTNPETGEKTVEMKEMFSPFAVDHRAIKGFTDWIPDVAFPKKVSDEKIAPRITINIGPGNPETKALLGKVLGEDEEIADVEYEVIEPKQLMDGEDDDAA